MNESKEWIELCEFAGVEKRSTGRCAHYYDENSNCYLEFDLNCKCSKWQPYNPSYPQPTYEKAWKLEEMILKVADQFSLAGFYDFQYSINHGDTGLTLSENCETREQALYNLINKIDWTESEKLQIKSIL